MRNKGDLSNFEHGVVVGARPAGLTISETKAAVLWVKIYCCLEMATVTQKKTFVITTIRRGASLNAQHVEPKSRWAAAAEDHTGYHPCQLDRKLKLPSQSQTLKVSAGVSKPHG